MTEETARFLGIVLATPTTDERINARFISPSGHVIQRFYQNAHAAVGPVRTPDHVQDVSRVLRLPSTLNLKYTPPRRVSVVWCEPDRCYDFAALRAELQARYPWAWAPLQQVQAAIPCLRALAT